MALVLIVIASLLVGTGHGYRTYYLEQDCGAGSLDIPLSAGTENSSVLLRVSRYRPAITLAMDCQIQVTAPDEHKVVVAIRQLDLRSYSYGTCKDYLKIVEAKCETIFRLDEDRHYISDGNRLSMRYHVDADGMDNATESTYVGLKLTLTSVSGVGDCSGMDWFDCDGGLCIWSGLRCDTHNNCGDLSDEKYCGSGKGSTALVILGIVILLLLLLMCAVTLLCTKNAKVRKFSSRLRSRTLSYLPHRFSR